jgi:hypothetical protein
MGGLVGGSHSTGLLRRKVLGVGGAWVIVSWCEKKEGPFPAQSQSGPKISMHTCLSGS